MTKATNVFKAGLAKSANDHRAIGSTPPSILLEDPDRTHASFLNDVELSAWMGDEVDGCRAVVDAAKAGNASAKGQLRLLLDHYLRPDFEYLRSIGRLPPEFVGLDLSEFEIGE